MPGASSVHGNDERSRVDRFIRNQLEYMFVDVVELSVSDLDDPVLLRKALSRIANKLRDRKLRSKFR